MPSIDTHYVAIDENPDEQIAILGVASTLDEARQFAAEDRHPQALRYVEAYRGAELVGSYEA